jgi:hypothetical protein
LLLAKPLLCFFLALARLEVALLFFTVVNWSLRAPGCIEYVRWVINKGEAMDLSSSPLSIALDPTTYPSRGHGALLVSELAPVLAFLQLLRHEAHQGIALVDRNRAVGS